MNLRCNDVKSKYNIMLNPNILADSICDLIRKFYNKNYVVCYGKDFIYLLEENKLNNMYFIHNVSDVIEYDGILIYKNRVNICNTGDFEYIREFIKYLIEFRDCLVNESINEILDDFVDINCSKRKSRIKKI